MQSFRIIKTAKAFFKGIYNAEFLRAKGISRIALYECLVSPYTNVSHASMRIVRMPRCEGLAPLGAKVLHRSVRRSCTARCEGLALLGANVSHASMREVRNPCFFLSFYFAPYIEKSHFFCYPSEHSTNK